MGLKKTSLILLLVMLLTAGCSNPGPTAIPTARPLTATSEARTSIPSTATSIPAPLATSTHTSSPTTTPTETPSPSPTSKPQIAAAAAGQTNIYAGPGADYPLLAILTAGFQVQLIGADAAGYWLVIRLPHETQGWVASDRLAAGFDAAALPVVEAPPKPLPTRTPVPAPAVIVSPNALAPNAKYTVTVLCFRPREHVNIKIRSVETGSLEFTIAGTTNEGGTADFELTTSRSAPEGAYILSATGDNGSYAETIFYVGPPK